MAALLGVIIPVIQEFGLTNLGESIGVELPEKEAFSGSTFGLITTSPSAWMFNTSLSDDGTNIISAATGLGANRKQTEPTASPPKWYTGNEPIDPKRLQELMSDVLRSETKKVPAKESNGSVITRRRVGSGWVQVAGDKGHAISIPSKNGTFTFIAKKGDYHTVDVKVYFTPAKSYATGPGKFRPVQVVKTIRMASDGKWTWFRSPYVPKGVYVEDGKHVGWSLDRVWHHGYTESRSVFWNEFGGDRLTYGMDGNRSALLEDAPGYWGPGAGLPKREERWLFETAIYFEPAGAGKGTGVGSLTWRFRITPTGTFWVEVYSVAVGPSTTFNTAIDVYLEKFPDAFKR
jgi:hypothetical protein